MLKPVLPSLSGSERPAAWVTRRARAMGVYMEWGLWAAGELGTNDDEFNGCHPVRTRRRMLLLIHRSAGTVP